MKTATIVLAGLLLAGAVVWSADRRPRRPAVPPAAPNPLLVKRGEYLVNEVARCGDCHTPRDNRGRLDRSRAQQGAPIWFMPKIKKGEWEGKAPDITITGKAGKWGEDKMIRFLMSGKESDPPMPAYRLSREDARAVTAYLRSLPGRKGGDRKGRERDDDDD
jgi:mono/diheme cytochrome c family protein